MKSKKLMLFLNNGIVSLLLIFFIHIYNFSFAQGGAAVNNSGASADPSAIFDVSSNMQGILIPRMTTLERDAIVNPAEGLQIINITTKCVEIYFTPLWQSMFCACSSPVSPAAGVHIPSADEIIWNWVSVNGATGYKVNTINDYSGAMDVGNQLSYTQIGLSCNTAYDLYVWAYSACGSSPEILLSATTTACGFVCGTTLTVSHVAGAVAPVNKTVNYGTVSTSLGGTGTKCWITQNLGADQQAASASDAAEASAGWYWQFNRKQGYKHDGTTLTPSPLAAYNPDTYHWQPENDPCTIELGPLWRVPTYNEWAAADGSWTNYNQTYSSVLKLHAAGYLQSGTGVLTSRGGDGFYWSSIRVNDGNINSNMWNLNLNSSSSYMNQSPYVYGFSVRCIMD